MASKGSPLGIGLSVDFAQLDADLSTVANKIDKVGANTQVKVGTLSGLAGAGGINTDQLGAQMAHVGVDLANGMRTGVSSASALLLGMANEMKNTLNKLAGVTISLFTRIDAAMRFPRFDAFLARADVGLTKLWKGSTKEITALDVALAGGFGKMAQHAAKIFNVLFADLGKAISGPIEKAVGTITPAIEKMAKEMADAFKALPMALNRPMATALEEFLGRLRGTLGATKQAYQVAGEANAKAFMFGVDATVKPKKISFVTDPKDIETLKKQAKALALGEKIKPPPSISPLPVVAGDRRFAKLKPEEIKPPSPTDFEKFFRSIRVMSKAATAQMQQDFRDVKPVPPKRIEPIKGRVATPSLGKDFVDLGKEMMQSIGPSIAKIGSGISAAREKFAAFSKEGYTIDQILTKIAGSFGGWGIAIAAPLGAFVTLGEVVVRTTSFFVDMGVRAVRSLNYIHNLFTSIGGIGNKTFKELFVSHGLFLGGLLVGVKILTSFSASLFNLATFGIFKRAKRDVDSLNTSVKAGDSFLRKLGSTAARVGSQMMMAFGFVGIAFKLVDFFKSGVRGATELNDTVASSKMIFGDSFGAIEAQINKTSKDYGVLRHEQLEIASGFGAMAQGAGMSEKASADFASTMTTMTLDFAKQWQIPFTEAADKIRSGLGGVGRELKQYGVFIDEDTIKTKAFSQRAMDVTAQFNAIAKAGKVAATAPVIKVPKDPLGSQAERDAIAAKTASKTVAAEAERAAIAGRNAGKAANLAKAKDDMKANQEFVRSTGLFAIKAAEMRREGLLSGAAPKFAAVVGPKKPAKEAAKPAGTTGIKASTDALTKQSEIGARASIIINGLSSSVGALERMSGGASAQFKRAGGGVSEFGTRIGELLLPAVSAATTGLNELLGGALDLAERTGPALKSWAQAGAQNVQDFIKLVKEFGPSIVANISWAWEEAKKGPLGFVISASEKVIGFVKFIPKAIGIAIRNAGTLWEIAKIEVGTFVENAIAYIHTIPANFGIIFPWILKNWRTLLVDLGEALKTIGGNLLENAMNLGKAIWEALKGGEFKFEWTPLLDGFKATTEKLPELIKPAIKDASELTKPLWDKIKANELKRPGFKEGPEVPGGKKAGPMGEDKKGEYKLGGALEAGSKEAFSAISRGMAGKSSTTDAVKQGVAIQKEQLKVSREHMALAMKQQAQKFDAR